MALRSRTRTRRLRPQTLASIAETVKNFAIIYVVDITEARTPHARNLLRRSEAARALLTPRGAQVPDFNTMYELFDPCTVMFFFRNKARARPACAALTNGRKRVQRRCRARRAALTAAPRAGAQHIMIDLGTGNNNKINWAFNEKQEMIDIIETVFRGARKGRGLVVSPKDYSTKYRY